MNKLQNTRQSCVNFPQIACWGKLHVLFKWSPQLQKSERLFIFIPPTVSIRSRSLKTARSERQSGIAWVSAEGKRQVRVSFERKKKHKNPNHPNPTPLQLTGSTNTVTDTDTEGEQRGGWLWSESDFGKCGDGSWAAGISESEGGRGHFLTLRSHCVVVAGTSSRPHPEQALIQSSPGKLNPPSLGWFEMKQLGKRNGEA